MIRRRTLCQLPAETTGGTAIEFALLGPVFIGLLIGVLQIGIGMQAHNAVRSVVAESARQAVVQYQTSNEISEAVMEAQTLSIATGDVYRLDPGAIEVNVDPVTPSRVQGAREFTITVDYQVPTVLNLMGWDSPEISHSRPVFVIDSSAATPSPAPTP